MTALKQIVELHRKLTGELIEERLKLEVLAVERNQFIADTNPKDYGSAEAQREAFLALKFQDYTNCKAVIRRLELNLEHIKIELQCYRIHCERKGR